MIPTVAECTGVPAGNILFSATHCHHAPNTHPNYVNQDYLKYVGDQMIAAGKLALEDRKPAKMYATSAELDGYNSCRHFIMDDGKPATTTELNPGGSAVGHVAVGHVVEADKEIQLVKFVREGGQDIIMLNWQAHPYTATDYKNIVSCTEEMRRGFENNNQLMIHFNGASGNVGPVSRVSGATNAMGDYGYIPSDPTFEYSGFEVKSCRAGRGAAEILQFGYVDLLANLNLQK